MTQSQTTDKATLTPTALATWCDEYLSASDFKDYCPNGLQVDADHPIRKLVTGVTACQALIEAAIQENADAILVHHGYFWKGEDAPLTGIKGKRVRTLLQHGISLLAYHLPLDAHDTVGNNACLGKLLSLSYDTPLYPDQSNVGSIFTTNPIDNSISIDELIARITDKLQRKPLHIAGATQAQEQEQKQKQKQAKSPIHRIGICTGAAQDMIEQAANMGCDVFISGEISERTTHLAQELGIDYLACGHHATEIWGVKALGELIVERHDIEVKFINIDNPA